MVSTVLGTAGKLAAGLAAMERAPSSSTDASNTLRKTILVVITC
jgi:hypothetical protein